MAKKSDDPIQATIEEQANMKPVPSQEDADKIKRGERVDATADQPKGPAQKEAEETAAANEEALNRNAGAEGSASYKTRSSKSE